jgi:hypothetical protein
MKKMLGQLFMEAKGPTVEYEGLIVHGAVFKQVKKSGRFIVRFIKAISNPIQALRIDLDPGELVVGGEKAPKMILRLDTSPDEVEVQYRPSRGGGRITLYNAWIDEKGYTDAWRMHAGMLVEETDNKMILRCSDGRGEPTFDDLVVEIEFLDDVQSEK